MDILTIGEVLIDLTQTGKDARGIPQFAANPGGAPANLAVAASRLGAQTAFIGKVGADAFGRYLKEVLAENKVDVSGMAVDADHPTTMAVVSVDATGERAFSFFLICLSSDNFENYYDTNFVLHEYYHWSIADIEKMIPYEREIYKALIRKMQEEKKNNGNR